MGRKRKLGTTEVHASSSELNSVTEGLRGSLQSKRMSVTTEQQLSLPAPEMTPVWPSIYRGIEGYIYPTDSSFWMGASAFDQTLEPEYNFISTNNGF